ncbi:MAG TPA: hypothetical protein VHY91_13695 [Pirellulales bacterium]|jgi:hypothetical protein|nr:hypothetical protein [Pirellulales bacterium]
MLRIYLEEGMGGAGVSLPPTPQVRLKGCFLCVGPNDQPLVRQERHLWTYGAVSFSEAVIDQPVRLRFETDDGGVSEVCCDAGLRIVRGRMIDAGESRQVLASYDEVDQTWRKVEGTGRMPHVLILPALPALPAKLERSEQV